MCSFRFWPRAWRSPFLRLWQVRQAKPANSPLQCISTPNRLPWVRLCQDFRSQSAPAGCPESRTPRVRSTQLLSIQPVPFLLKNQHAVELVGGDLVEADIDTRLQRGAQIERVPEEQAGLRRLRGVELVERSVVTAATVVRRIGAELRIAKFLPAQGPTDQELEGGPRGPLPACQFGPPVSWKAASSASMAALTATAW